MCEYHKIIVVGAGLSGMYAAWQLRQAGYDVIVLESRNRTGGRILSCEHEHSGRIDLGPAWVWPEFQPRLQRLISRFNLSLFQQYTTGDMLYEKSPGEIERYRGQSAHNQSYRIAGGCQSLIDALHSELSRSCIHLNTRVQSIQRETSQILISCNGNSYDYKTDNIILALPPRLIQQVIQFSPPLGPEVLNAWHNLPTWMAAQSKILFFYKKPFWREQYLSGEVFSQAGPLSEIYDGSPKTENFYALTAFVGLNATQRHMLNQRNLINACLAQLQRLFGKNSLDIIDIQIKDWSQDPDTSTNLDLTGPIQHPYYAENMPRSFWNNHLIIAGTEVAREQGGYLEGALESVDEAVSSFIYHEKPL